MQNTLIAGLFYVTSDINTDDLRCVAHFNNRIKMGYKYKKISVNGRKVDEHRYVMEQHLGRYLRRDEIIRWIDGDVRNNAPENLEIMSRKIQPFTQLAEGTLYGIENVDKKYHAQRNAEVFGKRVMILSFDGKELMIVSSIRIAAKVIKCNKTNAQSVVKGTRSHVKGFKLALIREPDDEECDVTTADQGTEAG